ncbi:MAG: NAD+ synthase [Chitinophagales bacterium]|nr:NAD+ synthase [Chitinophagales bacterium]MCZ2392831.1 NAD+ synthase [Chitinophagales bacterium]
MKIAIAQQNYTIGDFQGNYYKIIQAIDQAILSKVDLIVFPEMSTCSYPAQDLLFYSSFTDSSTDIINQIVKYTNNKISIIIGGIYRKNIHQKFHLYNAAFFISQGEIQIIQKNYLLNDDNNEDNRYFELGENFNIIQFQGQKIAIQIGNVQNIDSKIKKSEIDLIIQLTSTPYAHDLIDMQQKRILNHAQQYQIPIIHCNATGTQGQLVLKGGSFICNSKGQIINEMSYFKEDFCMIETENIEKSIIKESNISSNQISFIHQALLSAIKDFFEKSGFKKAVLGLSGGIDSALVLALAAEALGSENVLSVLMPSQYSSQHSIDDSLALVKNLGSPHIIVPIQSAFNTFEETLTPHFAGLPSNVTEENLQARIRGVYLMAFSNKFGYILLNTSNKSESAVGYGTLYGDLCGAIGLIGDLYKTQVYELCKYINRDKEMIPLNIITKAPSAELRPDQKDSDSLPDYSILDSILYLHIEQNKSLHEIVEQGYDKDLVARIFKLVQNAEFKRYQSAPSIKVSSRAFGSDRKIPLVNKGI